MAQTNLKILTQVLALPGMKVTFYHLQEGIGILLKVAATSKTAICHRCGKRSHRLHQNHRHVVKDIPWGEEQVFLEINRRQFKCETCQKPFSEELDFIARKRNYTRRLARQTLQEVLEKNIESDARIKRRNSGHL